MCVHAGVFARRGTCGNVRVSGALLTSGVRRTPDLSSVKQSGFREKVSQKLRHHFLFESVDWG
jgi:hypothetical protein